MKVVLRHKVSGQYYCAPGKWVRRADNALVFESVIAAREFSRVRRLGNTHAVFRLAPFLMPLLHERQQSMWEAWTQARTNRWYLDHAGKFLRN
jgi:hypothetical protein